MSGKNEEIRSHVERAIARGETVYVTDGKGAWENLPGVTDTYPSTSLADSADDFIEEKYGKE